MWASEGTTMFSGKHRDTGFNLQVAATLAGDLLAVSAPVPGSRHDVYAWRQSHFPDAFAGRENVGDLGYVGSGMLTGRRKPPGQNAPLETRCSTGASASSVPPSNARSRT
ncbi:hypothetical protein M878_44380 [Streptomyces roseochromogenus subsp. oscitans DS 12.976]|uniref:DDE Tnp4 domain-containing protein n=1 Tax=Streptomyces roseochromogenus subsp. oscitans DS 12.976 TaxID=1352936 RepID=V6JGB8_STRRC|nr:hypothetical protein M878_44380 [Streptomyces roseochromogenus subsp. oscitans DS 12.976]